MTTIVYRDGVIAYDSRLTAGGLITTDSHDKHLVVQGHHFFWSGAHADVQAFVDWFFGSKPDSVPDLSALVMAPSGQVWVTSCNSTDGLWKAPVPLNRPYAIGSGSPYAWGAMDMGADAIKAVRVAAGRDTGTGGKIRSFKVGGAR